MATSMDFPGKSKKYSETINNNYQLEQPVSFVAVPGPQGERGPKGDNGLQGPQGIEGKQGPKDKTAGISMEVRLQKLSRIAGE